MSQGGANVENFLFGQKVLVSKKGKLCSDHRAHQGLQESPIPFFNWWPRWSTKCKILSETQRFLCYFRHPSIVRQLPGPINVAEGTYCNVHQYHSTHQEHPSIVRQSPGPINVAKGTHCNVMLLRVHIAMCTRITLAGRTHQCCRRYTLQCDVAEGTHCNVHQDHVGREDPSMLLKVHIAL
jgi:hypothetical protein